VTDIRALESSKSDHGSEQLPGERLRIAREKSGLSQKEVAAHLKLSVEKIYSLELGDVSELAAPVYVAGYLRAYAKLVGLPGDEIVADFSELSEMNAPSVDPSSSPASNNYGSVDSRIDRSGAKGRPEQWGLLTLASLVILVVVVVAYFVVTDDEGKENSISASAKRHLPSMSESDIPRVEVSSTDEKNITEGSDLSIVENGERLPSNDKGNTEINQDKVTDQVNLSDNRLEEQDAGKVVENQEPNKANLKHSVLVFNFNEDSWVDVSDASGKRLLYLLGKTGTSKTVWGIAPFNIQLGYLPGVEIRFNGKEYDLSGYNGRKKVRLKIGG